VPQSNIKKFLLFIPAIIGFILHAPIFYFTKWLGNALIKEEGHYDSKIVGFLFLLYPLFLLIISGLCYFLLAIYTRFYCFCILPFTAWAFVQLKPQMDQ
jgi:apolipoprotein N-acyltransferase